jgi:N-formylglutamate amidohydrolase
MAMTVRAGPDSPERRGASTCGGSIPGAPGKAAFTLALGSRAPLPVLIAVPHAGRAYPPALLDMMRHPEVAGPRLEDRFIDLVAEAVARETGAALLVADAPRAMIDLNRAPDDVDWEMVVGAPWPEVVRRAAGRRARSGLGLIPRRLPGMGELWKRRLTREDLAERITSVHQPYHAALSAALESLRDRWGAALLLDLHSMPPLGPKSGADPAPDFVVGDRFGASCDRALAAAAFDHLAGHHRRAAHNRPYAGGFVLEHHGAPARGIHAMQVELCRTAYLDAKLRQPGPGMQQAIEIVAGLVRRMAGVLGDLAGQPAFPQAAE